jgi:RNase P subunit RPR2
MDKIRDIGNQFIKNTKIYKDKNEENKQSLKMIEHFKKAFCDSCKEKETLIMKFSYEKIRIENKYILRMMITFALGLNIGLLIMYIMMDGKFSL